MADEESKQPDEQPEAAAQTEAPEGEAPEAEAAATEAEAAATEAPEAEAAAEPAGDAAPAPAEEAGEEEALTPKQARKRARSRAQSPAKPPRSGAERAAERAARRRARAAIRRRRRGGERAARAGSGEGTPPAERREGSRKVRQGTVISAKPDKTITVRIEIARRHPVYEKVVRRSATLHAHDERNDAHEGDVVRVVESRPLSKTKRWRLVEILERAR